jgi:hypothetical protein
MIVRPFKSYDEYVAVQTETNRKKLTQIWVTKNELRKVARYIRAMLPNVERGICHGVRNAFEVEVLRDLLGCECDWHRDLRYCYAISTCDPMGLS